MKPIDHAANSAKKFGGKREDYVALHDWFDQTKMIIPDLKHRAVLHNAFGIYLAEQVFGHVITNSDGKDIPTRSVAEQHVIEDLGFIPSLVEVFQDYQPPVWMYQGKRKMVLVD